MNSKNLFSIIAVSILIAVFCSIVGFISLLNFKVAQSASGDNVSGWAWSNMDDPATPDDESTIGWISFNCNNPELPPPLCDGLNNYGVNIEPDGSMTGYAYFDINDPVTAVEEVAWIDFAPVGPYPTCPVTTCPDGSPNYSATVDTSCPADKCWVRGWAKVVNDINDNGSADDWVLLGPISKSGSDYGVYIDRNTGDFHGWAWGSDAVGWISFNHSDPGAGAGGLYKVSTTFSFDNPPSAINLSVESPYAPCSDGDRSDPPALLSWTYSDPDDVPAGTDPQSAYRVQVDNNSDFSSPEVDSGIVYSVSTSYAPPGLSYGANYYWRVMVWDSLNNPSNWAAYPGSFLTVSHAYPSPDFTHSPLSPSAGEVVAFTDASDCWDGSNNLYACKDGAGNTYQWDFQDDGSIDLILDCGLDDCGAATTTYDSQGNYTVRLKVTDDLGTCESTGDSPVGITPPLPEWKEVSPF